MNERQEPAGEIVQLPPQPIADPVGQALEELELVYAFVYSRVGNRADAEDLTQQVAMKAIPRLRAGAPAPAIRAYLFATARSALAGFWAMRFGVAEEELPDDFAGTGPQAPGETPRAAERVASILALLPENYRRVLELRFLRGYSIKEAAQEMRSTPGAVKVMQLRALRAAARRGELDA